MFHIRNCRECGELFEPRQHKQRRCGPCTRRRGNERRLKAKTEALAHYGGGTIACANPFGQHDIPYTDIRALTLDYINGGHGRTGMPRGRQLYRKLLREGWPLGWQVLCSNCQLIKVFVNEEQPRIYKRRPQLPKLPFNTMSHGRPRKESTLKASTDESTKKAAPVEPKWEMPEPFSGTQFDEFQRKAKPREMSEARLFVEKERQVGIDFAARYDLKAGQSVRLNRGVYGILDVIATKSRKGDDLELRSQFTDKPVPPGHRYSVSITSDIGFIQEDIWTTGSTLMEAMKLALRALEDQLCPTD